MITPRCISILDLVGVYRKLVKGPLHVHKVTRLKANATSSNDNTNPVSHIIKQLFYLGFRLLAFEWIGRRHRTTCYMDLFPLSTPRPSTHANLWLASELHDHRSVVRQRWTRTDSYSKHDFIETNTRIYPVLLPLDLHQPATTSILSRFPSAKGAKKTKLQKEPLTGYQTNTCDLDKITFPFSTCVSIITKNIYSFFKSLMFL